MKVVSLLRYFVTSLHRYLAFVLSYFVTSLFRYLTTSLLHYHVASLPRFLSGLLTGCFITSLFCYLTASKFRHFGRIWEKFLHIWSVEALLGRNVGKVIAYYVSIGATWKECRLSWYIPTHKRRCLEEL